MTAAYGIFAVLTLLICLRADRIGEWLGVMDRPDGSRKLHQRPTPMVGGTAVAAPLSLVAALLAWLTDLGPLYLVVAALTAALWLLGLADDRRTLRPSVRLTLSLFAATTALWAVPDLQVGYLRFSFLGEALFLGGWAIPFTLLCLVGLQNAVNMADGKNGLVTGMLLIWTGLVALYAPSHLAGLLWALAAMLAVVLGFNLAGRLFLGDAGTYALAVLVGLLGIYTYNVGFDRLPADMVALWFLVPVVDCLRLIVWRGLQGRSPFAGDRNHLHHHLERLMPWRWGLPCYLALIALPALAATQAPQLTLLWALLSLSCYAVVLGLGRRQPAAAVVT
jgi:UDP-GlcNAc:undecaprenyl-phosphate GlcNAc-1-phosphate transferase